MVLVVASANAIEKACHQAEVIDVVLFEGSCCSLNVVEEAKPTLQRVGAHCIPKITLRGPCVTVHDCRFE